MILSDYVAVLDKDGRVIRKNICGASNKQPLAVYSQTSAAIILHSDSSGSDNGKGFAMKFKVIDYEPSGCGDPKNQVLIPNNPTIIT